MPITGRYYMYLLTNWNNKVKISPFGRNDMATWTTIHERERLRKEIPTPLIWFFLSCVLCLVSCVSRNRRTKQENTTKGTLDSKNNSLNIKQKVASSPRYFFQSLMVYHTPLVCRKIHATGKTCLIFATRAIPPCTPLQISQHLPQWSTKYSR